MYYYRLFDRSGYELFLGVGLDLTAAFAQLLAGEVEDCSIVAYVVWGICPGTEDCSYFSVRHIVMMVDCLMGVREELLWGYHRRGLCR